MLIRILLSTLILFQSALCVDVPEQIREIYGDVSPCDDAILNSTLDEIKGMDERKYGYYKMQMEKCENYKQALLNIDSPNPWSAIGWTIVIYSTVFFGFWYAIISTY